MKTEKGRDLGRLAPKVHGGELVARPGTAGEEMLTVMRRDAAIRTAIRY